MRRSDALAQLSRDHHHGLVVAQRLSRADDTTAADARDAFLGFWEREGRLHFRAEEEALLPAFARHVPPRHADVVRVLTEHVDIRRRAADLAGAPAAPLEDLHELGRRLHDHIRHEERVLFPLIEEALPDDELAAVAAAVEIAERG
jgi:hypothetical protein